MTDTYAAEDALRVAHAAVVAVADLATVTAGRTPYAEALTHAARDADRAATTVDELAALLVELVPLVVPRTVNRHRDAARRALAARLPVDPHAEAARRLAMTPPGPLAMPRPAPAPDPNVVEVSLPRMDVSVIGPLVAAQAEALLAGRDAAEIAAQVQRALDARRKAAPDDD